jgi:hypothetical protein
MEPEGEGYDWSGHPPTDVSGSGGGLDPHSYGDEADPQYSASGEDDTYAAYLQHDSQVDQSYNSQNWDDDLGPEANNTLDDSMLKTLQTPGKPATGQPTFSDVAIDPKTLALALKDLKQRCAPACPLLDIHAFHCMPKTPCCNVPVCKHAKAISSTTHMLGPSVEKGRARSEAMHTIHTRARPHPRPHSRAAFISTRMFSSQSVAKGD